MSIPVRDGEPVRGLRAGLRTFELPAPLHPILVHFTIALTSASLVFEVAAWWFAAPSLRDAAWWTIAFSVVATVATVITGILARLGLPIEEGTARSYLRGHMLLGPLFFGLLLATAIWRANIWQDGRDAPVVYLATLAVTVAVMTVQGYLGGELVYRYGADVRGKYRSLPVTGAGDPPRSGANPRA